MSKLKEMLFKEMPSRKVNEMKEFYRLVEDLNREQLEIISGGMYESLSFKNKREIIGAIKSIKTLKGDVN